MYGRNRNVLYGRCFVVYVQQVLGPSGPRKTVMRTTMSILRVSTLFFVQEMSNSVVDTIETLKDA